MTEAPWNVVCFSGVDWEYNRQRPQWVMSGLASRGSTVLYVDNLGIRLPRPSDARRVIRKLRRWARTSIRPDAAGHPAIRRDAPIFLPFERPRALRWLAERGLARRIRRRAGKRRPLVVWTYSPLPAVASVARILRADLLVYDWADDASEHVLFASRGRRRRIALLEEEMLRRADVAFVASAELLRRRTSPNPRTFLVPHGVTVLDRAPGPSPELARAARPRIGFVGTVSEWVDTDLLDGLAEARPSWSFVLVGPVRVRADRLLRRPNVICLGPRAHDQVGALMSGLDVGLIPYRRAAATEVASPVKLHEYMAYGVPVVSTDLPEVRQFAPPARIASGPEGFLASIDEALREGRQAPRRGPSWDERVERMVQHVVEALAGRRG